MRVSNALTRRRLWYALIGGIVLILILLIRLAYVQLWIGPELSQRAEASWRRDIPFAAKRGEIWDRNGERLAYNVTSPTLLAVPAQVKNPEETAAKLADVLGVSRESILELITRKESKVYIRPAGVKISEEKANEIREMNLPGIWVAEDNKRYYPFGSLAAHVLGFTGIDNQGLTGVERAYDKQLTGISGSISYLSDARGEMMPGSKGNYQKPIDGLHLQLTIDAYIQSVMEREFDQAWLEHQPDHILGIAMDPNTGEILAMASRPTYDPGNYRNYPSEVYNRNLPIWMTYEPGSTFKIITLAAALEEGKVNLSDPFYDPGFIEVAGARLRCWKRGGHGSETFQQVVENSCNPGFVVMGERLGKESLFDYIKRFGFGAKTGIDLGGEENGILFKLSQVGPVELATTSFGQGVSVTPIQQVAAVAAAINGGTLYKPHVAKAYIHPETGEVLQSFEPEAVRQVISEETSRKIRESLEKVVALGTGRNAFIDGYRVGGKTGTAQKVVGGRYSSSEYIVSFIGFAPADNPQVIIYVAVDNPKGIQFGGLIAAPIVRNIMEDTLHYLNVEPRKEQVNKEYKYPDVPDVEVPDMVGMTVAEIYEEIRSDLILETSGAGSKVISQQPAAGTRVPRGSIVRIYLSDQ